MWADLGTNATIAVLNNYAITDNSCTNTKCAAWVAAVASQLPNGSSNVTINGTDVTIIVTWRAPDETTANQQVVNTTITPSEM